MILFCNETDNSRKQTLRNVETSGVFYLVGGLLSSLSNCLLFEKPEDTFDSECLLDVELDKRLYLYLFTILDSEGLLFVELDKRLYLYLFTILEARLNFELDLFKLCLS